MSGDRAYHELFQITTVELAILGLVVALYVNRRGHRLFPLTAVAYKDNLQIRRLPRRATRFLIGKFPELCLLGSISAISAPCRR